MSLVAHYPLNGDTLDYSGNGFHAISGDAVISDDAKLGKSYSFDGVSQSIVIPNKLSRLYVFSIGFWIKAKPDSSMVWRDVLSFDTSNLDFACRIELSDTNGVYRWYGKCGINPAQVLFEHDGTKWEHVVIVADDKEARCYKNGILQHRIVRNNILLTDCNKINIGKRTEGYGTFKMNMNDLRLYDHALSEKEVKELYRTKVLHYKFDDFQEPTTNLAADKILGLGRTRWEPVTTYPSGLPVVPISVWKRKDANTYWGEFKTFIPTNPSPYRKIFTISCWYYLEDGYNGEITSCFFGAKTSGGNIYNDIGTTLNNTFSKSIKNKWLYGEQTIKITTDAYSYDYLQGWGGGTISNGSHCYIANFQIEEKDYATSFVNGIRTALVCDCSGYKNNSRLDINSSPKWTDDSKIGSGAYSFTGASYIVVPDSQCKVTDSITVSAWAYRDNWDTNKDMRIISCTESGGWNIGCNDIPTKLNFSCYIKNVGYKVATYPLASIKSGWHLITATFDKTNVNLYLDGILVHSAASNGTEIGYHSTNGIFIGAEATASNKVPYSQYWDGKIDDVRIYATALSETDVKELYQSRASLDNYGNLFIQQLVENIEPTENLIINGDFSHGLDNWGYSKSDDLSKDYRTEIMYENGKPYLNVHWERLTGTGDMWASIWTNHYKFVEGASYKLSCKLRINEKNDLNLGVRHSALDNDYWTQGINIWGSGGKTLGVWHDVVLTRIFNSSYTNSRGEKIDANPIFEIYSGTISSAGKMIDFDIKDVQIECKDHKTPFIDGVRIQSNNLPLDYDYRTNTIKSKGILIYDKVSEIGVVDGLVGLWKLNNDVMDYSGCNNHAIKNGAILANGLRQNSYLIGSSEKYERIDTPINMDDFVKNYKRFTLSVWVKPTGKICSSNEGIVFGNNGYNWGILYRMGCFKMAMWGNNTGNKQDGVASDKVAINTWHHVVGYFDSVSNDIGLYLNGILIGTTKLREPYCFPNGCNTLRLGASWMYSCEAYVQDARLYNRILTPEEAMINYELTKEDFTNMKLIKDILYVPNQIKEV